MEKSFLDIHKETMDLGFWDEQYKSEILRSIENAYKTEVIREWGVSDVIIKDDKSLVKWFKRHRPLTDEELADKYGRNIRDEKLDSILPK